MSYSDGYAAIALESPARIPRTEYSLSYHYDLLSLIGGTKINADTPRQTRMKAVQDLYKAWNFDFFWNTNIFKDIFHGTGTFMGHAAYASGGSDFNDNTYSSFKDAESVLAFDSAEYFGAIDMKAAVDANNKAYREACESQPDGVNMNGIYVSCISGLLDLFGWTHLLEAAGLDPEGFGRVTKQYGRFIYPYFESLALSDAPVVMVHDDIVWTSGPFIHPDWYRRYVFPTLKRCIAPLIEAGKKVMFTADGNYTMFLDDITGCGVNGFVMEPLTDLAAAAEKYGKTHCLIGNADTRILLMGTKEDIYNEVKRCMDIGRYCPGFFMAVGNHIPANTPLENVLWYNECYEKMSRR